MKKETFLRTLIILMACILLVPCSGMADETSAFGPSHVTLWQLLKAGGWTMIVLGCLSVVSLTVVFYNFLTIKPKLLVPPEFTDTLIMRLESHDLQGAKTICEKKNNNIISAIALAGINRYSRGRKVVREAMEKSMNKEITKLWKSISYLGDIASVAPLLGLLGTVIGMIQAFNVISTAGSMLKPTMLVGGISKALITTAVGLVIAVPTLAFYSYFRGRVQEVCDDVDEYSTDIIKLIEESVPATKISTSSLSPLPAQEKDEEVLFHA